MKELFAYLALGAVGLWVVTRKSGKAIGRMSDTPVSLENVRKGVARGWYTAQLCKVDSKPAVKLSGTANGKPYSDYYPVTQATWNALQKDGVQQIGKVCGVGMTIEEAYELELKNSKLPVYDMAAWERDRSLNPQYGQRVADEVIEELLGDGFPNVYTKTMFQPNEPYSHDRYGRPLWRTFTRPSNGVWRYAGLMGDYSWMQNR